MFRTQLNIDKSHVWDEAIFYGLTLIGAPYCWWSGYGWLDNTSPSWSGTGPLPDTNKIFEHGVFCAGLVNLMLRKVGLTPPLNPPFNGGTDAYGKVYYDKLIEFDILKVRRGDAVFRPYLDIRDQGHIGIALGDADDKLLQCFAWNECSTEPGVNCNYTVRESHNNGYYQFIIPREYLWSTEILDLSLSESTEFCYKILNYEYT